MDKLAVFWNFTSFHEAVMEVEYGPQWYRKIGAGVQPEAIDIRSIMKLTEESGEIVANYAYGDWRQLESYAGILREFKVTLLQFFPQPRGRQEVVSDELIKDIIQLTEGADPPTQLLLVGGSNKLLSLREPLKAKGVKIKTCSIASPANQQWEEVVDDFIAYRSIARPMQGDQQSFSDPKTTHQALIQTFLDLRTQYGQDWVKQVKIKPVLLRHLPNFQESEYGYSSFGAYLGDQREVLDRRQPSNAREAEYSLPEAVIPEEAKNTLSEEDNPEALVPYYLRVAAQQGVRMPAPEVMWIGIDIYAAFLESNQIFESFSDLDDECLHQLQQDVPDATLTDAKKIRQVLFKCYLFRPSKDGTIGFQDEVKGLEDIEDRYFRLMLSRIGNNVKLPINFEAMSLSLTGDAKSAAFLEDLHQDLG